MAIVYYYIPKEKADIIKNGIKVSEYYDKSINIESETRCIIGLLSPKDDISKYNSKEHSCVELEVNPKDCFVLDSDLDCLDDENVYYKSAVPLQKYKFGTYRRPEVAITADVPAEKIKVSKPRGLGSPIIFDNSDALYKGILFEELRLKYADFDETLLGIFFMLMVSKGKFKLLGNKRAFGKTVYVYKDNANGKIYTLDIKEVEK